MWRRDRPVAAPLLSAADALALVRAGHRAELGRGPGARRAGAAPVRAGGPAMTRLVLVGLGLALVAGAGWHLLQQGVNAFAADQRERSALIRSEGSWTPPTNDPNIHYAPPAMVDLDHQGARR